MSSEEKYAELCIVATWLRHPATFQVLLRVLPCPNIPYGLFPRWLWETLHLVCQVTLKMGLSQISFLDLLTEFDAVHRVLMHQMGLSPKRTGYSCRINLEDVGGDSSFLKDVSAAGCRIQRPRRPPLVCHRGYRPVPSHMQPYCNCYCCNCFAASYFFPQL